MATKRPASIEGDIARMVAKRVVWLAEDAERGDESAKKKIFAAWRAVAGGERESLGRVYVCRLVAWHLPRRIERARLTIAILRSHAGDDVDVTGDDDLIDEIGLQIAKLGEHAPLLANVERSLVDTSFGDLVRSALSTDFPDVSAVITDEQIDEIRSLMSDTRPGTVRGRKGSKWARLASILSAVGLGKVTGASLRQDLVRVRLEAFPKVF